MCLNNNYPSNAVISYCLNALKGPSNPTPYMTCVGLSNPPKKRKVACIPGTQMTLVLVGKGLLFGGLKPKNWYLPAKTQQKKKRKLEMGVSKNKGTAKWMVYNGKPY